MAKNERTGTPIGKIAAQGLKDPGSLTKAQIQKLASSALTQRPPKK